MTPPSATITRLCWLVVALAVPAAGIGLFFDDGAASYPFTTVHGQTARLYGTGLYRHDTVFTGAGQRATDAVILFLAVPLLLYSLALYRRGSLRGRLLLAGTLAVFVYVHASAALGTVAYNELFLVYVALFSASLWAFIGVLRSVDPAALPALPRRDRQEPECAVAQQVGVDATEAQHDQRPEQLVVHHASPASGPRCCTCRRERATPPAAWPVPTLLRPPGQRPPCSSGIRPRQRPQILPARPSWRTSVPQIHRPTGPSGTAEALYPADAGRS